mmetsp:Transcript_42910/g.71422  ORF Transcript_42910/g.71422 Transcript_42910/m.71422 type:complete len:1444 (-) Transcript_42910:118-4449(-)|eukprot:CAMPEP_0184367234 /NCGR_PEP_ID=MMETSP1089-20130417/157493_1 /TAXON_ID=38269 ORGANISM="Gloeochaete wittrockiana, Strain SAG46.84" /NCGR_SAMPLE_ID=MMETSP1089 /ASSEMBLY_ACC=CAM_ASM_000445 /LENGTH=1443 /DNA_ID=CAMNT_0026709151 /DNA_START=86 /DNA_END=4417 /DNA_ORIENTATION=-
MKGIDSVANENPGSKANFLSRLTFWWLNSIIALGYSRPLEQRDLYSLQDPLRTHSLLSRIKDPWDKQEKEERRSLTKVIGKTYIGTLLVSGVLSLLFQGSQIAGPLLLRELLKYLTTPNRSVTEGYLIAVALGVIPIIGSFCNQHAFFMMFVLGMSLRSGMSGWVYRKSLLLSNASRQGSTTGQVVVLMSNDSQRFVEASFLFHSIWTSPLVIIVVMGLLIWVIGPSALAGVGVMLILFPISGSIAQKLQTIRTTQTKITDERTKLMNEVLQGIRIIKFFAWEEQFMQKMAEWRAKEIVLLQKQAYLKAWNIFFLLGTPTLVALATFVVYSLTGGAFTPEKIFTALALFTILRFPLTFLPIVIGTLVQLRVSMTRLSDFLSLEEMDLSSRLVSTNPDQPHCLRITNGEFVWEEIPKEKDEEEETKKVAVEASKSAPQNGMADTEAKHPEHAGPEIKVKVVTVSESEEEAEVTLTLAQKATPTIEGGGGGGENKAKAEVEEEAKPKPQPIARYTLSDINVEVQPGSLVAIVGPVGSGKSSLVSAMLGDMKKRGGDVMVNGRIAYVAQQAWIINASLRENILFGSTYDQEQYSKTVDACALGPDVEMLPAGHDTEIGEKGINLSGGQKQRVSIARSVYSDADIYVMDDCLSAVDAHVSRHIFEKCLVGVLKGKTRILVTNQLQYLPFVDYVVVMKDGRIAEQGTYQRLMQNRGPFADMVSHHTSPGDADSSLAEATDPASADSDVDEDNDKIPVRPPAVESDEKISEDTFKSAEIAAPAQLAMESEAEADADAGKGTGRGKGRRTPRSAEGKATARNPVLKDTRNTVPLGRSDGVLVKAEDKEIGTVPMRVYWQYALSGGGVVVLVIILFGFGFAQTVQVGTDLWLSVWSSQALKQSLAFYVSIYAAFGVAYSVILLIRSMMFATVGVRAAKTLYQNMFGRILRAPMSFFDTTPIGRILNRFSKDTDQIDQFLPSSTEQWLTTLVSVVATCCVISVFFPWFLVALVPIGVAYWFVQQYYRRTSRELQRLESVSKSPLFAHFSETLSGVSTIRAYGMSARFTDLNDERTDVNNRAFYLLNAANRWLGLRLDILGGLVMLTACLLAVIQRNAISPAYVGLVVSYTLNITGVLNWSVRMSTEVESKLTSVERVLEYSNVPVERPAIIQDSRPRDTFPENGRIKFEKVVMSYREGLEPVLNNLSFVIEGGEKVGIVGRTGSGKSSMMLCLFRIVELSKGRILIDDVDISTIGLQDLRQRLAIIPQDPVLFSGTIKENLDPFGTSDDDAMWEALEAVCLRSLVEGLPEGLSSKIVEGGENFSVGQRQLFCLARAILRKARVLVLDEATANIDYDTDALIQKTIRTVFKRCTVLTVAHRLNTIMDSERILVLSDGVLAEFADPNQLLSNPNSLLTSMVDQTGVASSKHLRSLASSAHISRMQRVSQIGSSK